MENVLDPLQRVWLSAVHRQGRHIRVQLRTFLLQTVFAAVECRQSGDLLRLQIVTRQIFEGNPIFDRRDATATATPHHPLHRL